MHAFFQIIKNLCHFQVIPYLNPCVQPVQFKLNHNSTRLLPSEPDTSILVGNLTPEVDDHTLFLFFSFRHLVQAEPQLYPSAAWQAGHFDLGQRPDPRGGRLHPLPVLLALLPDDAVFTQYGTTHVSKSLKILFMHIDNATYD